MKAIRDWIRWHSLRHHALAPIWKRVPERFRWRIVDRLNNSDRYCWCDLVDAALRPTDGADACDGKLPLPGGAERCRTDCGYLPEHHDHVERGCTCYCGKFAIEKNDPEPGPNWAAESREVEAQMERSDRFWRNHTRREARS